MSTDKKLRGGPFNWVLWNLAHFGVMDPDMPQAPPAEILKAWEAARPKLIRPLGSVIVFGTGGSIEDNALDGHCKIHEYMNNLNFGDALIALKQGKKVSRSGWNGKGMYLSLQPGSTIESNQARNGAALERTKEADAPTHVVICPHIDMRAADGSVVVGWLASQTDMLSDDWGVVE